MSYRGKFETVRFCDLKKGDEILTWEVFGTSKIRTVQSITKVNDELQVVVTGIHVQYPRPFDLVQRVRARK